MKTGYVLQKCHLTDGGTMFGFSTVYATDNWGKIQNAFQRKKRESVRVDAYDRSWDIEQQDDDWFIVSSDDGARIMYMLGYTTIL